MNLHGYGDNDNVTRDAKILADIINRQGSNLLIDALSEHLAKTKQKFNLSFDETKNVAYDLCQRLQDQLDERI